ncbi:MAG: hypothetical protein HKN23_03570 [Verrucomicrobiales bacterium]|nr:hypothetical protein [Verrucomicrobiales bacterium]
MDGKTIFSVASGIIAFVCMIAAVGLGLILMRQGQMTAELQRAAEMTNLRTEQLARDLSQSENRLAEEIQRRVELSDERDLTAARLAEAEQSNLRLKTQLEAARSELEKRK